MRVMPARDAETARVSRVHLVLHVGLLAARHEEVGAVLRGLCGSRPLTNTAEHRILAKPARPFSIWLPLGLG